jgi:hypothetical protein
METTTMPKNLKKLIEARRAKTGETYQTALRHIRAQSDGAGPGSFERLAREIVRLARQRNASNVRSPVRSGGAFPVRHVSEIDGAENTGDVALREALERLPLDALHKIEALMYAGCNECDVLEEFREVPKEDKVATVRTLVGKKPLDWYLEAGIERARESGLDLDSDFAAYPEPPRSYVIDMNHTIQALDPSAKVPGPARKFAEYVGSIVLAASAVPRDRTTTSKVRCRQCSEFIEVRVTGEPAKAEWACPGCSEQGVVSNWQGTLWDAGSGEGAIH